MCSMLHQVLETDKGAGFMEERTLGPVLKHAVGIAREQGRERQKELSRLMTQST